MAKRPQSTEGWHCKQIKKGTPRAGERGKILEWASLSRATRYFVTYIWCYWWWKEACKCTDFSISPIYPEKVKRPSNFVDFYSYAFRYCLTGTISLLCHPILRWNIILVHFLCCFLFHVSSTSNHLLFVMSEEKQKSIDIESICELLDLVLGSQFRAQVDSFVEYLKVNGLPYDVSFLFYCGGHIGVVQRCYILSCCR